ncbi:hypothetical protein SISNIDRAFT_409572, partial [Sistotremastrum niveocremeum HHB9708]
RIEEIRVKEGVIVEAHLKDKIDDMYYVHILATDPEYQGQGHGGTLLDIIGDKADAEGRDAWLTSSGPHNVPFYNLHGYETVAEIKLGEDDPTWQKGELVCPVVSAGFQY